MNSVLKAIGLVLIVGLMVCFAIFFIPLFIGLIVFMVVIFGIAWLCNVPFTVKQNDVKIGTYTRKGGFKRI